MFDTKKSTTVRTVRKGRDNMWYVYRRSMFGNYRLDSHGFKHHTSAWTHLGKLTAREQSEK